MTIPKRQDPEPREVTSVEVGRGPGLDPPAERSRDEDVRPEDEAFATRETHAGTPPERPDEGDEAAGIVRPPSDS